ncbi:MAG: HAMP domain-containing sensor histidine kinase, partial [Melioribacteraceae bacterium]|nr:HAMP domain-containing sensor histidine kinase [Melioribacteraceae bacterium]
MKNKIKLFFNSLTWQIGFTFLLILMLLSAVYLYIAVWTAEMYYQEAVQKMGAEIAPHIVDENKFFTNGEIDEAVLKKLFHEIMVINPSLEVYLLDNDGNILTYFAPYKKIVMERVDLEPIKKFVAESGKNFVMGNNPRDPNAHSTFTAAEVYEDDVLKGYLYIIISGEEFKNAAQFVFGSFMLRLALRSTSITLIAAIIITFISLLLITKNLRKLVGAIRKFKNGDLDSRITYKQSTELKEFANAFNEMADTIVQNMEDLKTMDNLRRELVANVSHDLRTPLATIHGYAETILMKSDTLDEKQKKEHLQTILGSTERLKKLVEELFELSKLEARETKPNLEAFQLSELAQDIRQKNLILAESKNIRLTLDSPQDLPLAWADIGMIERVFQNLIDNAMKFTPKNGTINIKLINQTDNIKVSIADSGVGISEEMIPHIYDRFNQGGNGGKKSKGLGLGLAIVKKILEV